MLPLDIAKHLDSRGPLGCRLIILTLLTRSRVGGPSAEFYLAIWSQHLLQDFNIGFNEPWLMDTPTSLGANIYDTRQVYGVDLRMTGASVSVGRRFAWPDAYFRGDWIVSGQKLDVASGEAYGYLDGDYSEISVTQVISRNSTDNPIFPTVGSNVSLSDELTGGLLLPGQINFQKHVFSADWYSIDVGTKEWFCTVVRFRSCRLVNQSCVCSNQRRIFNGRHRTGLYCDDSFARIRR